MAYNVTEDGRQKEGVWGGVSSPQLRGSAKFGNRVPYLIPCHCFPALSDTMAPEGLRPHSAIGAASGVTAPLEGRPAKDFSNWSCDTSGSSSVRDRGPRIFPGAFFVSWQQCRAPRREPRRQGAERRAGSGGATGEASPGCRFPGKGEATRPERQRAVQPPAAKQRGCGSP